MQITIRLYGVLRIDRFKEEVCEYPDGTSVQVIVDELEFPDHLFDLVLINGVHARVEDVLKDGDTLSLLPLLDGG